MGQNEIHDTDPGQVGGVPYAPVGGVAPAPPPSTVEPSSSSDDSSIASSTSTSSSSSYDSSFPQLDAPSDEFDFNAFLTVQTRKERDIARDLLDKWLESLDERARRTLEELRSPQYHAWLLRHSPAFYAQLERNQNRIEDEIRIHQSPEYLSWVGTLNPRDRDAQVAVESVAATQAAGIDAVGSYVDRTRSGEVSAIEAMPLVAASIAIGVSNIGEVITAKEVGKVADMNAAFFEQLWDHITPTITQEIRPDILGLIGAMMMVRLTALTTVEMVENNPAGKLAEPKKFGEEYAKLVIQLVTGKDLDNQCAGMLAGQSERPGDGSTVLKIVFLSTALALLYKQEAGKITGEEFDAMITGEIPLKKGDTKAVLVGLMRTLLSGLPADTREKLLDGLFDYMNGNPKVEEKMTEAAKLYASLLQSMPNPRPIAG